MQTVKLYDIIKIRSLFSGRVSHLSVSSEVVLVNRAKAKIIKLLLQDGDLNGIMQIDDSAWNGEIYVSPRESVGELAEINKYGVYLLLSNKQVYVGQASDLKKRIKEHLSGKDWWERAILLTTKDDSFTKTDIDYMESVLIGQAVKNKILSCDNRNKGNNPKVDKFRKITLDQYLYEALFLMELIGVSVFSKQNKKNSKKGHQTDSNIKNCNQDKTNDSGLPIIETATDDEVLLYYTESKGNRWQATCKCSKSTIESGEKRIPCLVLSGSKISTVFTKSCFDSVKQQHQEYANFIDENGIISKDIEFTSSSAAAMFVSGSSKNGLTCWKNKDGVTLKELLKK